MTEYRAHRVIREDRPDGAIFLRSGYPLTHVADRTTDWLDHWARETPNAVFLAERSGTGWRKLRYAEAAEAATGLAAGLLARGLDGGKPLLILSGNGIDHGLLALACQYVGIPVVPIAEQYSLIAGAQVHVERIARTVNPGMVYAADGDTFGRALSLPVFDGLQGLVSQSPRAGNLTVETLASSSGDITDAIARTGPDTVVKILMTSGSTSAPKGVETTHRMMCTNQAQIADAMPFVLKRPPRLVDWLPWNHVFGGSHNFNLALSRGGSIHIDGGKPVPNLIDKTFENNRMISATFAFNVPVGYAMLRDAMRHDPVLKQRYFEDLDMLFYAGASLPQDVWKDLEEMAREVRGNVPLFTSSWGLTETAPAALVQYEGSAPGAGIVGVPMTGLTIKAVPTGDGRLEIRVKGPSVFRRYYRDPDRTAEAFDDEGYFVSGDAMRFVDETDMTKGLRFDGRIAEDFKLTTGTWVRAAQLRLELLGLLTGLASDLVICGEGRDEIGLLIFPPPGTDGDKHQEGALRNESLSAEIRARLRSRKSHGTADRVCRALVLSDPPSMPDGEVTAKGNLNFRRIIARRSALVGMLYSNDAAVIQIKEASR